MSNLAREMLIFLAIVIAYALMRIIWWSRPGRRRGSHSDRDIGGGGDSGGFNAYGDHRGGSDSGNHHGGSDGSSDDGGDGGAGSGGD